MQVAAAAEKSASVAKRLYLAASDAMRSGSKGSVGNTGAPCLSLISHSKTGLTPLDGEHLSVALSR